MIGIGITTTPKRGHIFDLCFKQIMKHTKGATITAHNDTEGKGVAYSKNQCLKILKDCDKIFLFDDDCFPIKDGWDQIFTGHHQMYLGNWGKIKQSATIDGITFFNNCAGVLMYLSKEAVEKVGAFNEAFGRYGLEHAEYSERVNKEMLTGGKFQSPSNAKEFIHSLDYDGPFEGIEVVPNLTAKEGNECISFAQKQWVKEPVIYRPL